MHAQSDGLSYALAVFKAQLDLKITKSRLSSPLHPPQSLRAVSRLYRQHPSPLHLDLASSAAPQLIDSDSAASYSNYQLLMQYYSESSPPPPCFQIKPLQDEIMFPTKVYS